jgi:hypothetical protein
VAPGPHSRGPGGLAAEGTGTILTGRNPDRLEPAAAGLGALSSAALDAYPAAHERFSGGPPEQTGRVLVTGVGPAAC